MSGDYHCNRCGTSIHSRSELCVRCYRELTVRCSCCTRCSGGRNYTVLRDRKTGVEIDCPSCRNERYVLLDYVPFGKKDN